MPHQPIHTERYTQIISRHTITDHLSTWSGNKIYFRNIVRKWFYDSVKSITDLLSNLNVYYIPHAFSTRKYVTWAHSKCMCVIHKCILQEVFFDLDSVTKITLAFLVSYFRVFKDRTFNNWLFGRKSLENSANKKTVKPYNKLTDICYISHWYIYISRIRIVGFKSYFTKDYLETFGEKPLYITNTLEFQLARNQM